MIMCVLKQHGFLTIVLIQVFHSLRKVLGICYLILLHHAGSKHPTHTPAHTYTVTEKAYAQQKVRN